MQIVVYLRTKCPACGGTEHRNNGTRKHGIVTVRYHLCPCGVEFRSEEVAGRVRVNKKSRE